MTQYVELIIAVLTPVLASGLGWAKNSLADGIIKDYEWRELIVTIFGVGVPAIALYFSINALGVDFSAVGAAFGGLLFDKVVRAVKAVKEKKK